MMQPARRPEPVEELCPRCGVSWAVLGQSLTEPYPSPNRGLAEVIVANCPACRQQFTASRGDPGSAVSGQDPATMLAQAIADVGGVEVACIAPN